MGKYAHTENGDRHDFDINFGLIPLEVDNYFVDAMLALDNDPAFVGAKCRPRFRLSPRDINALLRLRFTALTGSPEPQSSGDVAMLRLTPSGIEAVSLLRRAAENSNSLTPAEREGIFRSLSAWDRPDWDGRRRVLRVGPLIVKRFVQAAENQSLVLAAFQETDWQTASIPDPLPYSREIDAKDRLHDTIKNLNRHQKTPLVSFRGDGTGEAVVFKCLTSFLRQPFHPDEGKLPQKLP